MPAERHTKRSFPLLCTTVAAAALLLPAPARAQNEAVQKPFESGKFAEALDAAGQHQDDPSTTFVAVQAALRLGQPDRARDEMRRLEANDDQAWKLIGRSAMALVDGNADEALNLANEATGANGDNPYAHYQLGLAAAEKGDHPRAAAAFDRAAQLKPDFAYAHYYAGLEYQRAREGGKAGDHLRRFLELAPEAPERGAVNTLLRSLRG